MEISFKQQEEEPTKPVFGDVEEDQFFVDLDGYLCQRGIANRYAYIADRTGKPWCRPGGEGGHRIERILPRITKINF